MYCRLLQEHALAVHQPSIYTLVCKVCTPQSQTCVAHSQTSTVLTSYTDIFKQIHFLSSQTLIHRSKLTTSKGLTAPLGPRKDMKRGKRNRINRKIHVSLLALLMFHSSGWIQRDHDSCLGVIHQLNISKKRNSGGKEEIV